MIIHYLVFFYYLVSNFFMLVIRSGIFPPEIDSYSIMKIPELHIAILVDSNHNVGVYSATTIIKYCYLQ